MTIKIDLVKIAKAAAIKITSEEQKSFTNEVENILTILDSLKSVDTEGVEPLMSVSQSTIHMREDIAYDSNSQETVMKSANKTKYGYFVTPKFVG